MSMHRSAVQRRRRSDAAATRERNRARKASERARRDARMLRKVREGSLPYTPAVRSWLSRRLGKPASKITPEDLKGLKSP